MSTSNDILAWFSKPLIGVESIYIVRTTKGIGQLLKTV